MCIQTNLVRSTSKSKGKDWRSQEILALCPLKPARAQLSMPMEADHVSFLSLPTGTTLSLSHRYIQTKKCRRAFKKGRESGKIKKTRR